MSTPKSDQGESIRVLDKNAQVGAGRIGVYTAMATVGGAVPLPWIPDGLARRVRGAMAQDVVARHGLSLTNEARAVLAEPDPGGVPLGVLEHALRFATTKLIARFTPLGFLTPVRAAAQVFALGHLLDRYMRQRSEPSVRIDVEEARRIRRAIDESLLASLRTELSVNRAPRLNAPEDLRDQGTQLLDGVLIAAASLPDWVVRRLEAAFDERVRA